MKPKLIIYNTHPIQYFAPLYKAINSDGYFDLEIWYGTKQGLTGEYDKEFGANIKWDLPILDGYFSKFLTNQSWKKNVQSGFWSVINFGIFKAILKLPNNSHIIAHGWSPVSSIILIIFAKILGHKTYLRAETPLIHEKLKVGFKHKIRKYFVANFMFKFIDKFLYIGSQNKAFYKFYGIEDCKLFFTPYVVNNDFFLKKSLEIDKYHIRSKLGIPIDSKVVLYSGKLIPKKNPVDLLKAFHNLNKKNTFLVFMGEGELRNALEAYIKENKMKNVLITGFINQSLIAEYYKLADIFTMVSGLGETWGLSVNEAMNFRLPVLVSDQTGSANDLVIEGKNGYVIKTNNILDITNKLQILLDKPENELFEMGQNSLNVIANYSFKKVILGLKEAIK
jgi:glycosyltransferase involved in cell wall biosynthesis